MPELWILTIMAPILAYGGFMLFAKFVGLTFGNERGLTP
jgi:hypothetical protein